MKKILIGAGAGALLAVVTLFGGTAIAGTGVGAVFNLGETNTVNAQSTLTGSVNGVLLRVTNPTGTSATAMRLTVPPNNPPFLTNGTGKVVNLNADKVDGQNAEDLQNPVYTFTTATSGGTGQVFYTIPQVPAGNYLLTYTAAFYPQGTLAAPISFSCWSINSTYTAITSQATNSSTYTTGFYIGVNGTTTETVPASGMPTLGCGAQDQSGAGVPWTWGSKPFQVTLVKLNGLSSGSLAPAAQAPKALKGIQTSTR